MPERGEVSHKWTIGTSAVYQSVGPLLGPGTLLSLRLSLSASAAENVWVGVGLGRDREESAEAFLVTRSLFESRAVDTSAHPDRTGRLRMGSRSDLSVLELPVGLQLSVGQWWVLVYWQSDNASARTNVWVAATVATRRGFGRRSGDISGVPVPAGGAVLEGLRSEARRASGRET